MMLIFLVILIADLWLWFVLMTDLKGRNRTLRAVVITFMSVLTCGMIILFIMEVTSKGDFADPANAYRHIVTGALGALLIAAGFTYFIMILFTWIPGLITKRKSKTAGLLNIIIFLFLVILFTDGYLRQRFDTRVVRKEISIPGLNPGLNGLKIVLISDLHLSSWYNHYDKLNHVISLINEEKPDLLVNTGDFITFGWQEYDDCDTILRKAVSKEGTFAVPGNHDEGSYHPGYNEKYRQECIEMIRQKVSSSGYTMLSDTAVIMHHNGTAYAIAGVVTSGHRFDMAYGNFSKVLGQIPDSLFTVLLLHDPAGWLSSSVNGHMPQLTLSGHTHGMQIGLPGGKYSPAVWIHKWWKGLYRSGDSQLYVTTGLGTMGVAVRIFMPPEIVTLTVTCD